MGGFYLGWGGNHVVEEEYFECFLLRIFDNKVGHNR